MGQPLMACPVCAKALRSNNRNGYCRRHRALSETYRATLRKAAAKWQAANPDGAAAASARYRARNPGKAKASTYAWRRKKTQKYFDWFKRMHARRRARVVGAEGSFTKSDIEIIRAGQRDRCYYCGAALADYHIDHKTPLSRGGSNWPSNLAVTCPGCNTKKNTRTEAEFVAAMLSHERGVGGPMRTAEVA